MQADADAQVTVGKVAQADVWLVARVIVGGVAPVPVAKAVYKAPMCKSGVHKFAI